MMNFEDQATTWNELGKQDPFWAILTHPEMEDGQWAVNQFYLAGQLEIETLLEEAVMELSVTAPPESGAYLLELDLVQEQTAWFGNRGSPTVHIPVDVSNKPSLNPLNAAIPWRSALKNRLSAFQKRGQPVADKKPRFEMHAIPAAEVLQIVANSGGRIVAIQHDSATGQDWQGFLYFITNKTES
jgi:hypothetical protein